MQTSANQHWQRALASHVVVILLLLFLFINIGLYTGLGTTDVVRFDQWRFLQLLDKYYENSLTLSDLWMSEVAKRNYDRNLGYNVFFIVNAELFGLDTSVERWLGLSANLLLAGFLYWTYRSYAGDHVDHRWLQWTFVLPLLLLFSMSKWRAYAFSLTAFKLHWILLLIVINFWLLDRLLLGRSRGGFTFVVFLVTSLLTFGGGAIPAVLVAMLTVVALARVAGGRHARARSCWVGAYLLVGGVSVLLLYLPGLDQGNARLLGRMRHVLSRPENALEFFLVGLGSSISDSLVLWEGRWIIPLGIFALALYAKCFFVYLRDKMTRKSYMPLMLMTYGLVYVMLTAILRLHDGSNTVNAALPRYAVNSSIGIVGCLWILGWHIAETSDRSKRWKMFVYAPIVAILISLQVHAFVYRWSTISGVRTSYERARSIVLDEEAVLEPVDFKVLGCREQQWCLEGLLLLRRENLNVFRGRQKETHSQGARSSDEE